MACCSGVSGVRGDVQEYYGKRVRSSADLMTSCCTVDRDGFTSEVKEALKQIHPEILSKNYGCGAVYPEAVEGCVVLDLGSGAGMDCFVLSKLVGAKGRVVGVDMTKEQLEVSRKHIAYHTEVFGYSSPNVEFLEGFIERLEEAGIQEESCDVIISNCVINLSPNKAQVLKEAYRVLKTGGEMYFSDIYSNQPVPESLRENKVLWGECLSGALHWEELMKLAVEIGFAPPVLVNSTLYRCDDSTLVDMLSSAGCPELKFCSCTYRLIKIEKKEEQKETLSEVQYQGTITGHAPSFKFSCQATLKAGTPEVMTSSVSSLIQACERLSPHFTITPLSPTREGGATPLTPPLAKFVKVNPFEMSTGSKTLAPPKALPTCCSEKNAEDDCCTGAAGGGGGSGCGKSCDQTSKPCGGEEGDTEPPAAKKPCCD